MKNPKYDFSNPMLIPLCMLALIIIALFLYVGLKYGF